MIHRPGRGIPRIGHPLLARGNTAPGLFALAANRYLHTFGVGRETLAKVAASVRPPLCLPNATETLSWRRLVWTFWTTWLLA